MKISVIVPCYNVEKYIGRCLESIERQTIGIENLEIILVDDVSTDNTLTTIMEFERKYPENVIAVVCEENKKAGGARNLGIDYASGDYITFVDADDILDSTMLEKMYAKMTEYDCEVVECEHKEFSESAELFPEQKSEDYYLNIDSVEKRKSFIVQSLKNAVWGRLYKREFIKSNKLRFVENLYYEDCQFSGMAMLLHQNYYHLGETLYYYFYNNEGTMHSKGGDNNKIKCELEVERLFLEEIEERGMLEDVLTNYYDELEFYVVYNGYIDALSHIFMHCEEEWKELIVYFREGIRELFPECYDNPYLKQIDLPRCKFYIRLLRGESSRTEKIFANRSERVILLMNTQEETSVSSHVSVLATKKLLQDYFPDTQIIEVTSQHYAEEEELLQFFVASDDVIVIVGDGGNINGHVDNLEGNVRSIVSKFPEQKIIRFPHKMFLPKGEKGRQELVMTFGFYKKHNQLSLWFWDKQSQALARMLLPQTIKCELFPEASLYLENKLGSNDDRTGCGIYLVPEAFEIVDMEQIENLLVQIANVGLDLEDISEVVQQKKALIDERESVIKEAIDELKKYKLIMTNSIECVLLCVALGTPCIALKDSGGHIGEMQSWLESLPYIRILESMEDFSTEIAQELLQKKVYGTNDFLQQQFAHMAEEIGK